MPHTRCASTTSRTFCRSSASLIAVASIRAPSSRALKREPRRRPPSQHPCPRRALRTRKTHFLLLARGAPVWTGTEAIQANIRPRLQDSNQNIMHRRCSGLHRRATRNHHIQVRLSLGTLFATHLISFAYFPLLFLIINQTIN